MTGRRKGTKATGEIRPDRGKSALRGSRAGAARDIPRARPRSPSEADQDASSGAVPEPSDRGTSSQSSPVAGTRSHCVDGASSPLGAGPRTGPERASERSSGSRSRDLNSDAAPQGDPVAAALAPLCSRLPRLPELPPATPNDALRDLRALARDAGRELKRLRALPRARTAPLARFQEACRAALAGLRTLERARRKLDAAERRLARDR